MAMESYQAERMQSPKTKYELKRSPKTPQQVDVARARLLYADDSLFDKVLSVPSDH